MKTAIFSVVYPGAETYLSDFFGSFATQDDREFEVFIINDGVANLPRYLRGFELPIYVREIDCRGFSPAKIRKIGIKWLAEERVDYVIFADSDDYFSTNRVKISRNLLEEKGYSVVVNDLILFGQNIAQPTSMFGSRLMSGQQITENCLKSSNCCGLSNTAVRLNTIELISAQIPDQTIAFDWALFSRMAIAGEKIIFTNAATTYYRQHSNNIADPRSLSEQMVLRGVKVKLEHYKALDEIHPWYRKKATQFGELLSHFENDPDFINRYIQAITKNVPKDPLWWEMIKPLEELNDED